MPCPVILAELIFTGSNPVKLIDSELAVMVTWIPAPPEMVPDVACWL
jgi:hypothetical protein